MGNRRARLFISCIGVPDAHHQPRFPRRINAWHRPRKFRSDGQHQRVAAGGIEIDHDRASVTEHMAGRSLHITADLGQGDGTASIFAGDASVFTISLHGANNFPFRKAQSDLDLALADGCTDADYLDALDTALAVLAREHAKHPFGLAFYLAGADPHEGDRLGRLKVSAAGLLRRDRRVLEALGAARIPVALAMAGGYGLDLDVTVAIQAATIEAAIDAWRHWNARPTEAAAGVLAAVG